jgi:hypothetical protein
VEEHFSEPKPKVIESSAGFSVTVLGMTGMRYVEGHRSVRIDSEVLAKPGAIALFQDSIKVWESPDASMVNDADRDRIIENIKRAFDACGYELRVHVPDNEWLAWFRERKRASEQP